MKFMTAFIPPALYAVFLNLLNSGAFIGFALESWNSGEHLP